MVICIVLQRKGKEAFKHWISVNFRTCKGQIWAEMLLSLLSLQICRLGFYILTSSESIWHKLEWNLYHPFKSSTKRMIHPTWVARVSWTRSGIGETRKGRGSKHKEKGILLLLPLLLCTTSPFLPLFTSPVLSSFLSPSHFLCFSFFRFLRRLQLMQYVESLTISPKSIRLITPSEIWH